MGRAVGIDLGTTYSAVAIIGGTGLPEIIPNREGDRITPSVVLFQDDSAVVGSMAKRAVTDAPEDVVQFVKRKMGDRSWQFITSTGEQYDAEWISAIILRRLKEDAELALGEPVTHAVITVPAYFDDARRRATIDAGQIAGFDVLGVINEPTAAAVAYGIESGIQGDVLVYDLGGGTFDVTVMRIHQTNFEVLASRGDRNLGGFNWDNELINYLVEQVRATTGVDLIDDDFLMAELREKVELAKRTLTTMAEAKVMLRINRKPIVFQLTRKLFEELTHPLLSRTRTNVELAIEDARLGLTDVDHLLLVGGSTRMPMVRQMLTALTGREPSIGVNPDEAVALGAAVQAKLLVDLSAPAAAATTPIGIQDVTAHGLGVVALHPTTQVRENHVLLPHNSKIPGRGSKDFVTAQAGQNEILVEITEGDDDDVEFVTIVGEGRMELGPRTERTPIRVEIAFTADAVITAEVYHQQTGEKFGELAIERTSNLSRSEIELATMTLQSLEVT
ncbi:MAG: Hsp70 family protein [Nakamurella sp.]